MKYLVLLLLSASAFGQVVNPPTGGGANLPSAGSPGQIISSQSASTNYAVQANVFYAQTGDTIASIESECSSPCTYVVTNPQTITLAAGHSLSSNVNLLFQGAGKWTVNGAFTLTIPNQVQGDLNTHFAGSSTIAFGASQALAPVEWFGAIGDSNGTTGNGTDNTTAIQNTLNALVNGQAQLQQKIYRITSALSITKSAVGIAGNTVNWDIPFYGPSPAATTSKILIDSASANAITVAGSSSHYVANNRFNNFVINRTQIPTGTAAGLSLSFTSAATVQFVSSNDSVYDFYIHASPSISSGGVYNSTAGYGYNGVTETTGTYSCFYLDSADGNPENSLQVRDSGCFSNLSATPIVNGMILTGSALNDVTTYDFQTAGASYGQVVNYTGGGGAIATQDIHFIDSILDTCSVSCYKISNVSNATSGAVSIRGGWAQANATATGAGTIDIQSSQNVMVANVQIHVTSSGVPAINVASSSQLVVTNNNIFGPANNTNTAIAIASTTSSTFTGNKINTFAVGMSVTNSSGNSITGNTWTNMNTNGVSFSGTSSNTAGLVTSNTFTSVVGAVADSTGTNSNLGINGALLTPSSSSANCSPGSIEWDTGFIYVCTSSNTWKRAALSTF
jgi:hypothetical protein